MKHHCLDVPPLDELSRLNHMPCLADKLHQRVTLSGPRVVYVQRRPSPYQRIVNDGCPRWPTPVLRQRRRGWLCRPDVGKSGHQTMLQGDPSCQSGTLTSEPLQGTYLATHTTLD